MFLFGGRGAEGKVLRSLIRFRVWAPHKLTLEARRANPISPERRGKTFHSLVCFAFILLFTLFLTLGLLSPPALPSLIRHRVAVNYLKEAYHERRRMLGNITVGRLLIGDVATSCTVFIDCGRLLLIRLCRRYSCCCCCEEKNAMKGREREGREIDLLSYGDKQHHGIIGNFFLSSFVRSFVHSLQRSNMMEKFAPSCSIIASFCAYSLSKRESSEKGWKVKKGGENGSP
jgi:hypothetical protein